MEAFRIRRYAAVLSCAAIPLVVACEESAPTEVGTEAPVLGTVLGVVHDSAAVLPEGRSQPMPADSFAYFGTLSGDAAIEVFSDANGWTPLGPETSVSFAIYCEEAGVVEAAAEVPFTTYSRVRLTLEGFVANVDPGAVLDGLTYDTALTVALGSGDPIVIERSVAPFQVSEATTTTLLFDLNTELWLDSAVVADGATDAADVRGAAHVMVR